MRNNWVKYVESAAGPADLFGYHDVVLVSIALEVAAQLEECQRDRLCLIKAMSESGAERHYEG